MAESSPIVVGEITDEDLNSPPRSARNSHHIKFAPEVKGRKQNAGGEFEEHHEMQKDSLTSIAKNHSPTVANAYAATPHNRLYSTNTSIDRGGEIGGESETLQKIYNSIVYTNEKNPNDYTLCARQEEDRIVGGVRAVSIPKSSRRLRRGCYFSEVPAQLQARILASARCQRALDTARTRAD